MDRSDAIRAADAGVRSLEVLLALRGYGLEAGEVLDSAVAEAAKQALAQRREFGGMLAYADDDEAPWHPSGW